MAVGVPCGPINDIAAAFSLAGELGLAPIVEIPVVGDPNRTEHRSRQVANPVRFSATPPTYRLPPPALPHHDR
jgi:crotonobetainyl-CoA:carnitine CoA-transferase CaiB-like acyl-CoA transferase